MNDTIEAKLAPNRRRRLAAKPKPAAEATAAITPTPEAEMTAATTTPTPQGKPEPSKPASKASLVLELLQRPEGATITQLTDATDWLPHTTRAALTGLKKKGHEITSEKAEGKERIYRVVTG